jgi:hypothetical protein
MPPVNESGSFPLPLREQSPEYRNTKPVTDEEARAIAARAFFERLGQALHERATRMASKRGEEVTYGILEDAGELAADELGS